MQVHAIILESIQLVHDALAASIDVAISVLILDSVIDVLLVLEKISQVWGRLVQPSSHLHVHPLNGLVRSIAIRVEVLIHTVIVRHDSPVPIVSSVFV